MSYQYSVCTSDSRFLEVAQWTADNRLPVELHLNRTRFWVPAGPLLTEFLLKWYDVCKEVKRKGKEHE